MTKVFPNNWEAVANTPDEAFPEIEYEDMLAMAQHWEVPSSHACIMRIDNGKKVKEIAYKTTGRAQRKIMDLIEDPSNVITICDDETIHVLKYPDDYLDWRLHERRRLSWTL